MMAPQAAKCFGQWVMLIEKYLRVGAIMQAGLKLDIISTPSLTINRELACLKTCSPWP
jgi:hypothetical protein